jgi:hypothetical protein
LLPEEKERSLQDSGFGEKMSFEKEENQRRQGLLWLASQLLISCSVLWKLISTYRGGKAITSFLAPRVAGQQMSESSSNFAGFLRDESENPRCGWA